MRRHARQPNVLTLPSWALLPLEQEVQWEADVERICSIDFLNFFAGQLERQRGDVAVEVRLLAASDDGEDVRILVEDVS